MSNKYELETAISTIKQVLNEFEGSAWEDLQNAVGESIAKSSLSHVADDVDTAFNSTYFDHPNYPGTQLAALKEVVQVIGAKHHIDLTDPLEAQGFLYFAASKLFGSSTRLGDDIEDEILDIFEQPIDRADGGGFKNIPKFARLQLGFGF